MAVASVKLWGIRLTLVGTALALLATSGPPRYVDTFVLSSTGPQFSLSRENPTARFLVRARALELSPKGKPTTDGASAAVRGAVTTSGGFGLVRVTLRDPRNPAADPGMNAVTSFDTSRELVFRGGCLEPSAGSPCESELEVSFERESTSPDAVSQIDWRIDFVNEVSKDTDDGNTSAFTLPWAVEIGHL